MKILYSARTDTGVVRKENQDAYGLNPEKGLFMVCDGMGGGAAGDFASKCAVEVMLKSYDKLDDMQIKNIIGGKFSHMDVEILRPIALIMLANRKLYNLTLKYPKLAGMGTTVVAARFEAEKGLLHIYHSGDSRLYKIRAGVIELLTKDHSKVNELIDEGKMREEDIKSVEMQSMITRALGTGSTIKVDYKAIPVKSGDYYVMCSDGLNSEIDDNIIKDVVDIHKNDINVVAKELIAAANNAGGRDNTTVLALKAVDDNSFYNPTRDYVFSPVTITEEAYFQSSSEDKFLSKSNFKIPVPKSAREKNFFTGYFFISFLIALCVGAAVFFMSSSQENKKDTKELYEITGTVSGISLDVRTPVDGQIALVAKAEDKISKMEVIRKIVNEYETYTSPLPNVQILIEGNGMSAFASFSSQEPLGIELPKGSYVMTLKYPGYKVLDNNSYGLVDSLDLNLEFSGELQKKTIIMFPETTEE